MLQSGPRHNSNSNCSACGPSASKGSREPGEKDANASQDDQDQHGNCNPVPKGKGCSMAGHTEDTFGGQNHGSGAHLISRKMASSTRCPIFPPHHMMNATPLFREVPSLPEDHRGLHTADRVYFPQVAGFAGYQHMCVMGYFFIMGRMTLGTLSSLLGVVSELRCLRVADGASDNLVGCGEVFSGIYGGNPSLGHFLCPGFPFAMAVKTESGHLPAALWII